MSEEKKKDKKAQGAYLILLFPGYQNTAEEWKKVVEYGHPNRGKSINFMKRLKSLKHPIRHIDIDWTVPIDIPAFVKDLHKDVPKGVKLILIGHSLGLLFCYYYAMAFPNRVKMVLSLDGSFIGPSGKAHVEKVLAKNENPVLVDYAKQTPLKSVKFPMKAICYRNLHIRQDGMVNYRDESEVFERVRYYINIGHFVQTNPNTVEDIVNDISLI